MLMGDMCTTVYLCTENGTSTLVRNFSNYKQKDDNSERLNHNINKPNRVKYSMYILNLLGTHAFTLSHSGLHVYIKNKSAYIHDTMVYTNIAAITKFGAKTFLLMQVVSIFL